MSVALRKPGEMESVPHEAGGVAYGRRHGRGAQTNRSGRFEPIAYEPVDDGWESLGDLEALQTEVQEVPARRIITKNQSPDIGFDRSINPYRGCEHGCIYCFARPTHAYHDLSPGVDFESRLFVKPDAAKLLHGALSRPGYECAPIAMGTNTDPYQPVEREMRITRGILEVLAEHDHPVMIVTKSDLVVRDLDILAPMAAKAAGGIADLAAGFSDLPGPVQNGVVALAAVVAAAGPVLTVGAAGGRTDPTLVRVRDLSRTEHDAMLALIRKKLRGEFNFPKNRDRYFGVPAVYSLENVKYPQADGSVCGTRPQVGPDAALKLDCGAGLGAATHITGAFAFAAAGKALEILLRPQRP